MSDLILCDASVLLFTARRILLLFGRCCIFLFPGLFNDTLSTKWSNRLMTVSILLRKIWAYVGLRVTCKFTLSPKLTELKAVNTQWGLLSHHKLRYPFHISTVELAVFF